VISASASATELKENSMSTSFIPLNYPHLSEDEQRAAAEAFYERMHTRRSVRHFSPDPLPLDIITTCINAAGSAPSGANQQPWRFVVVSDPEIRRKIRVAAEREEKENYERRFPTEWKQALAPLGTDWKKEYLSIAPLLIVVFQISYEDVGLNTIGGPPMRTKHYYVTESVGIAVGVLLSALHHAGLATLTHTPNPMNFLNEILGRPKNERPYVLIPVGYAAEDAEVPNLRRKSLDEIMLLV
jgi:iodotyrosine deiodinase